MNTNRNRRELMGMDVGFLDIMELMGKRTDQKNKNYYCPFCGHGSLTIYPEGRSSYCHTPTCQWSGDPIDMFGRWKGIEDYNESVQQLAQLYLKGFVQRPKARTLEEAKREYEGDLEFLGCVRMYLSLNLYPLKNQTYYQKKSGESPSTFSKVINGNITDLKYGSWKRVIGFLREEIDVSVVKSGIEGKGLFRKVVNDPDQIGNTHKFLKK